MSGKVKYSSFVKATNELLNALRIVGFGFINVLVLCATKVHVRSGK